MATCYIIGAGDFFGGFEPSEDDLIIAADGGYDSLKKKGIAPHLLIGDLDSVEKLPEGIEIIRFPVEKDDTDSFLAYREGVKRGFRDFEIYGGTGGREDHTFANLSLLLYARERGHRARLVSSRNTAFVIKDEEIRIKGEPGKHFSAFAFGCNAEGVTLRGLQYCAEDITLTAEFPLAVSNLFTDSTAVVSVKRGALLIMTEN